MKIACGTQERRNMTHAGIANKYSWLMLQIKLPDCPPSQQLIVHENN
jgi:hypothetical protein